MVEIHRVGWLSTGSRVDTVYFQVTSFDQIHVGKLRNNFQGLLWKYMHITFKNWDTFTTFYDTCLKQEAQGHDSLTWLKQLLHICRCHVQNILPVLPQQLRHKFDCSVKGQRIIIWTNLVDLESLMLYTKIQRQSFLLYGEDVLPDMGRVAKTISTNCQYQFNRRPHKKSGENWLTETCIFKTKKWRPRSGVFAKKICVTLKRDIGVKFTKSNSVVLRLHKCTIPTNTRNKLPRRHPRGWFGRNSLPKLADLSILSWGRSGNV